MNGQAARLKVARVAAGYSTAASAARPHGWHIATYQAHERGQNGLKGTTAAAYADALKTAAEWLLTGAFSLEFAQRTDIAAVPCAARTAQSIWYLPKTVMMCLGASSADACLIVAGDSGSRHYLVDTNAARDSPGPFIGRTRDGYVMLVPVWDAAQRLRDVEIVGRCLATLGPPAT
ncbi:putative phage repressor [Stappia sp. 22II-S9-Z10]|nr:putative phage repressor [Stappia sp. 22II-S9-Z10]